jgi:hypothetical protein
MIQMGGQWTNKAGKLKGNGLFYHYKELQRVLWPKDVDHRWADLLLSRFLENEITVMMGCSDSNKTYAMSRFALCDYWCFPNETLWLISSTEYRGAELRIWGKIKELFNRARDRFEWLPGNVLEAHHALVTDTIDENRFKARTLQKGMILVPCKKGAQFVGLGAFVGVKAPRLRHAGDEVQHMEHSFLDAYSNWYGRPNFKGLMAGNPLDISEPLCTAAEPIDGWDSFDDNGKTQEWKSKFFDAHVIALDGRDSPNFDYPEDTKDRFPFLIGRKKLAAIEKTHGKDSWQWFNQCVGKPNKNLLLWRVITKQVCVDHKAFDKVLWAGTHRIWILALDPAYGGGDRCVCMPLEFGDDVDMRQVVKIHPPEIVPVNIRMNTTVDDQIANYMKKRSDELSIPPENIFYESFGKGTIGYSFARVFGSNTPIPVNSGGTPTKRPVRFDLFVDEGDPSKGETPRKRLKRCDEHYSKFITELWWSVRECVESEQMRELPTSVAEEGYQRIYTVVKGDRIEVEPKEDLKERIGKSPDFFDTLAVGIEGARQRGFKIERLGLTEEDKKTDDDNWLRDQQDEHRGIMRKSLLSHS